MIDFLLSFSLFLLLSFLVKEVTGLTCPIRRPADRIDSVTNCCTHVIQEPPVNAVGSRGVQRCSMDRRSRVERHRCRSP